MALEIVAAKDLNHAFEIASMPPKKRQDISWYQNRKE